MRTRLAFAILLTLLIAGTAHGAATQMLEDFEQPGAKARWEFSNGPEFPGANGAFGLLRTGAHGGKAVGSLTFDFQQGGAYTAAVLRTDGAPDVAAVFAWIKKPAGVRMQFRYTDQTGQTLQKPMMVADDRWYRTAISLDDWTGHWGGADDGVVHGPPTRIAFLAEHGSVTQGKVLLDDIAALPGRPGSATAAEMGQGTNLIAARRFVPAEQWSVHTVGPAGSTRLAGRTLTYDFTAGATSIELVPRDEAVLGTPTEFRLRVRGRAAGHPVRLHLATHFTHFEKTIGTLPDAGDAVLTTSAPPGEGWRCFWGENDNKLHGPLRVVGIALDRGAVGDRGTVDLVDLQAQVHYPAPRACALVAEAVEKKSGTLFTATLRNVSPRPIKGRLLWTARDWAGSVVARESRTVTVPADDQPLRVAWTVVRGTRKFLEGRAEFVANEQIVPAAYAYSLAPVETREDPRPDPASPFGMGVYLNRYGGDAAGLAEMDSAARHAAAIGVKWTREDINWPRAEPAKGQYDWAFYDAMIATAKRHGISIYGLVMGWPAWTTAYSEQGIEDYCRFVKALVTRYRNDVRHWEIWNEPNIFFWQGPKEIYPRLLRAAYQAIKEADPTAQVLGCSTAGVDRTFITQVIDQGGSFDAVTIHPYRTRLDDAEFLKDLADVAALVKQPAGAARPIWITEMGWATSVPHNTLDQDFTPVTPREQAALLARAYVDAIASGSVASMSWYDFRNDGYDPLYFEHNMGIVARDFQPKPAYRAYAVLASLLKGLKPAGRPRTSATQVVSEFKSADGRRGVTILWSVAADMAVPAGTRPVLGVMGDREPITRGADGKKVITLRAGVPVYILRGWPEGAR